MGAKATTAEAENDTTRVQKVKEEADESSSDESVPISPAVSRMNSANDITDTKARNKIESLRDRGRIPSSFYVTTFCILMLQGCSGMYKLETLQSWWLSIVTSIKTINDYLEYERDLMKSAVYGELRETSEYIKAGIVTAVIASLFGIFIYVPFRAGLWTGQRATRHKVHRFMGLFFLIQYAFVWVEFLTNYSGVDDLTFLPHTLSLNGTLASSRIEDTMFFRLISDSLLLFFNRNCSRLLCLLFLQSPPGIRRRRIYFRQGCYVAKVFTREHFLPAYVYVWFCLLSICTERKSAIKPRWSLY